MLNGKIILDGGKLKEWFEVKAQQIIGGIQCCTSCADMESVEVALGDMFMVLDVLKITSGQDYDDGMKLYQEASARYQRQYDILAARESIERKRRIKEWQNIAATSHG